MGNYNSSADDYKKSLLPEKVQAILQRGIAEGYKDPGYGDDYLDLSSK